MNEKESKREGGGMLCGYYSTVQYSTLWYYTVFYSSPCSQTHLNKSKVTTLLGYIRRMKDN